MTVYVIHAFWLTEKNRAPYSSEAGMSMDRISISRSYVIDATSEKIAQRKAEEMLREELRNANVMSYGQSCGITKVSHVEAQKLLTSPS